ncbi:uncharacterized protein STEHIDRAFT_109164 [Stereum hirsutum FP-91666 SS1]|uniref:uncharacterized protein n=1 Tax=Stereum hirsutum (strain FP-91666) TaxID=721885 RepID=UPI000440B56D|nr:uncharacterized protein STEHIDRAFT_109164 [Stereum hirsutum FP-91666 SS1]EIM88831.1 hypothetical protein STEHIDRAFT_109164 [Stereum hirsutum FP-91666 SS1]
MPACVVSHVLVIGNLGGRLRKLQEQEMALENRMAQGGSIPARSKATEKQASEGSRGEKFWKYSSKALEEVGRAQEVLTKSHRKWGEVDREKAVIESSLNWLSKRLGTDVGLGTAMPKKAGHPPIRPST